MASMCRLSLRGALHLSSRTRSLAATSYLVRHLSSLNPCEDAEEHHEEAPSSASGQGGKHYSISQSQESGTHDRPAHRTGEVQYLDEYLDEMTEETLSHEWPLRDPSRIVHLNTLSEEMPRYERPTQGAGEIVQLNDMAENAVTHLNSDVHCEGDEDMEGSWEASSGSSERPEENEAFLLLNDELDRACNEANVARAYEFIEKMADLNLEPRPYLVRSLMKLCIKDGRWDLALDMVGHKAWATSDVWLHHMAIMACRRRGRWEEALSVVESMKTKGLQPDGAIYASAIAVCGAAGQWARGVQLLEDALTDWPYGLTPNMFNAAISACCRGEAWEMVTRVVGLMEQHGVAWDSYTYSALMDAYAKGRRADEALQLFDKMVEDGVQPDRLAYTVAMGLHVRQGDFDKVLQLFKRMKAEGLEPDGQSYAAALTACSGPDTVEEAVMGLLADYRKALHRPSRLVYVAAVAACAREGRWRAAMVVLEQMVEAKVLPDFWVFAAATEACTNGGVWAETLGLLQASPGRGRFVSREEYEDVMLRAAGAARERCGPSAKLAQDLVATQALQAEEKDLWTAVVGCQNKSRWRRLLTLLERLQDADKAEGVVSKGKKRGRAALAKKGLAVQLPHALVLTGVRLGLLREAVDLFNALEKVAAPLGEEALAEREMVYRVLVRGLLKHRDAWGLPLEALREELEAPQAKRTPRGKAAKRGAEQTGRGLEAYKLAAEVCVRARQGQALKCVLELYQLRHGSDEALRLATAAVVEDMYMRVAPNPHGTQPVAATEEGAHRYDASEGRRLSKGSSGIVRLDDFNEEDTSSGGGQLSKGSSGIVRLDDFNEADTSSGDGRLSKGSSGIVRLDDLQEEDTSSGDGRLSKGTSLDDETPKSGQTSRRSDIQYLDDFDEETPRA